MTAQAQKVCRYRVSLKDKAETEYKLEQPESFLSEKALQRRARQGLPVDSTDLPVCRTYKERIAGCGVDVVGCSKWNNTVLVESPDSAKMEQIATLPFVYEIRKVWIRPDSLPERDGERAKKVEDKYEIHEAYYGAAQRQVTMLKVDKLHEMGYKGNGMSIAVIDGGFHNADIVKLLRNVKIKGVRDFVNDRDAYAECDHGTKVLSCMAANEPNVMVGTAPEADYWLLCSEDNDTEYLVEEDYWAEAVEFADSVGVDVVNTSLGYSSFNDKSMNYTYSQLDGSASLVSATASKAADKGMLVVCSAGNEGNKVWKKITVPADANHVLTVGAVDANGVNTLFSSVGNTTDGRIKPDVMAMGGGSAVIGPDGSTGKANGTSFASPTLCGAATCLWQACPYLTAKQLIKVVQMAGSRSNQPDNIFGYGIPDFEKAYQLACDMGIGGMQEENVPNKKP